ncbi:MAG: hypothetical protein CMJ23_00085 [Phycisphaerae bacterium]|nr:hypothetical protein [Phycisphaerae bacterium]
MGRFAAAGASITGATKSGIPSGGDRSKLLLIRHRPSPIPDAVPTRPISGGHPRRITRILPGNDPNPAGRWSGDQLALLKTTAVSDD